MSSATFNQCWLPRARHFIVFTDKAGPLHFSHERYLVSQLRRRFGLEGIPIELNIRGRVKRSEGTPLRCYFAL